MEELKVKKILNTPKKKKIIKYKIQENLDSKLTSDVLIENEEFSDHNADDILDIFVKQNDNPLLKENNETCLSIEPITDGSSSSDDENDEY